MGQFFGGPPAVDNATVEYNAQAQLRIKANSVDNTKLKSDAAVDANRAVTTDHIRDDAVDANKLKDDAVTDANRAVTTNHIRDLAVVEAKIGAAAVAQAKLKTAIGEVSTDSVLNLTLPGGEYGFYPQIKKSGPATTIDFQIGIDIGNTTYVTNIHITSIGGSVGYAQQRYVTASGQDDWVFLLVDKVTGNILAGYSAPDHPMYGNGGDINAVPHPFIGNDLTGKEIVILGKADIAALKVKATKKDSILTIINRDHKIDILQQLPYQPLHSGEFIDKNPVLITQLPTGITVKKLKAKV